MASFAASLLDELMGRNRNADPNDKSSVIHWSSPEVCKQYLVGGFCTHDLFTNTRSDLGPCSLIHDNELIKKYNASSRYLKMGYEEEFLMILQELIGEIERKIRRGHQRLALNQELAENNGPIGIHSEKLKVLSDRITELVEQAEKLGCEGRIEEAQGVLKLCDQLKDERNTLQESASMQLTPKEMEVCPVCGSFLVVGDAPQRVEDHQTGKQHVGYAKCRDMIDTLRKKLRGEDPDREARLQREREERDREKEKERAERDRIEKERVERERKELEAKRPEADRRSKSFRRSRSRSRHGSRRGSRSRSRDRRRDAEKRRSRSRDAEKRRSRSRDAEKRRSRSRDAEKRRSRSRDADKLRSRSRDADRRKRSRSGERRRDSENRSSRSDRDNGSRRERGSRDRSRDRRR